MPPIIDHHASILQKALEEQAVASLAANRIDPKFLYVTPRQAALWREVFLRYSPVHSNPDFWRIYNDGFAQVVGMAATKNVHLIGLGCGTGIKERELLLRLVAAGKSVTFSAIDVSRALVDEAMHTLSEAGARSDRALVCDLDEASDVGQWLNEAGGDGQRVLTLFGLVPNLVPSAVARIIRSVLRPGDVLLVNAHLAPVSDSLNLQEAMLRVLPQYDQAETLAWLAAGIENWGLENRVEPPRMTIGAVETIPAFLALARWKSAETFVKWGYRFSPELNDPLQVFRSLRYTPDLFEDLLRRLNLNFTRLAMTLCREEAIWAVQA